jgi:hypothetical protein
MSQDYSFPQAKKQSSIVSCLIQGENVPAFLHEVGAIIKDRFNDNKYLKVLARRGSGKDTIAVGSSTLILPVVAMVVLK